MELKWNEFKSVVDSKGMQVQYVELESNYWIKAFDGRFEIECLIPKDESISEVSDFVTNYKTNANHSLTQKVVQQLGMSSSTALRPRGFQGIAVKNVNTNIDYEVTETFRFLGGFLYSHDGCMGDSIDIQIVDKNYILAGIAYPVDYNGIPWNVAQPSGVVLKQYVSDFFIAPKVMHEVRDIDLSDPLPTGLFMRLIYKSCAEATVDTKVLMNLLSYVEG